MLGRCCAVGGRHCGCGCSEVVLVGPEDGGLQLTADFVVVVTVAEDVHGCTTTVDLSSAIGLAQKFYRRVACVRLECQDASDARFHELKVLYHHDAWDTPVIVGASRTLNSHFLSLEGVVLAAEGDMCMKDLAIVACEPDVLCPILWAAT